MCRRRRLKVNPGENKLIVLNGEEGLECELYVDRIRLEHESEFKYFGCVLDDGAEFSRKMAGVGGGWQVPLGP